jgi:hypothetical protein
MKKKRDIRIRRKWLINPVQRPHSATNGELAYNRRKEKQKWKNRIDNDD